MIVLRRARCCAAAVKEREMAGVEFEDRSPRGEDLHSGFCLSTSDDVCGRFFTVAELHPLLPARDDIHDRVRSSGR